MRLRFSWSRAASECWRNCCSSMKAIITELVATAAALGRIEGRGAVVAASDGSALDGCSFLVVVPSVDHQIWQRTRIVVIAAEHAERIFEGLPAARVHLAVAAPRGFGIIEAGPSRAYGDLVGILRGHVDVEVVEIIASPVAAVALPSTLAGMNPRVEPVE